MNPQYLRIDRQRFAYNFEPFPHGWSYRYWAFDLANMFFADTPHGAIEDLPCRFEGHVTRNHPLQPHPGYLYESRAFRQALEYLFVRLVKLFSTEDLPKSKELVLTIEMYMATELQEKLKSRHKKGDDHAPNSSTTRNPRIRKAVGRHGRV